MARPTPLVDWLPAWALLLLAALLVTLNVVLLFPPALLPLIPLAICLTLVNLVAVELKIELKCTQEDQKSDRTRAAADWVSTLVFVVLIVVGFGRLAASDEDLQTQQHIVALLVCALVFTNVTLILAGVSIQECCAESAPYHPTHVPVNAGSSQTAACSSADSMPLQAVGVVEEDEGEGRNGGTTKMSGGPPGYSAVSTESS